MNFRNTVKRSKLAFAVSLICSSLLVVNLQPTHAQTPAGEKLNTREARGNREMGSAMLGEMKKILEEYYYDPKYRGMDLKARLQAAQIRIKKLNYNWEVYRVLAQVLLDFNDSHTGLILPPRSDHFEYGFTTLMIGDKCLVVGIKKDSDAEKKGLRVGDQVLRIGKFAPTRENLWKIMYLLYKLDPGNTLDLKIKNLAGMEAQMTVAAMTMTEKEFKEEQKKRRGEEKAKAFKCQEINTTLIACKLYTFRIETNQIDKMMKQVGEHSNLILDLRGNRGGHSSAEEYLTGYLFDHDVKIADEIRRKRTEIRMARSQIDKSFKGALVVLVDSNSTSASEMVARVVQLEKRGKIVGDVTGGAVMTSITFGLSAQLSAFTGFDTTYTVIQAAMSVTIGDVIMKDGSRIERVGVIPDETIRPTGFALAKKADPVLAHAATLLGAILTAEQAGKFYFLAKKDEDAEEPETIDEE